MTSDAPPEHAPIRARRDYLIGGGGSGEMMKIIDHSVAPAEALPKPAGA